MRAMANPITVGRVQQGLRWTLLSLYALLIGFFLIGMPRYHDDWHYMWPYREAYPTDADGAATPCLSELTFGNTPLPLDATARSWAQHRNFENGRLANFWVSPALALPKWIGSGAAWLAWLWGAWALVSLSVHGGIRRLQLSATALLVAMLTWFMPWQEHLGSMTFQFNYLIGTAWVMLLLIMVWRGAQGWPYALLTGVAGYVAGAWQEALSLPVGVGLAVALCISSRLRTRKGIAALAGLLLGWRLLWRAPGLQMRLNAVSESVDFPAFEYSLIAWAVIAAPYLMALVCVAAALLKKERRKGLLTDPWFLFLLTSGAVSVLLPLFTEFMMRVAWWADFASIGIILHLIPHLRKPALKVSFTYVSLLLAAASIIRLISADLLALDYRRAYTQALAEWISTGETGVQPHGEGLAEILSAGMPDPRFFSYAAGTATPYFRQTPGEWYYKGGIRHHRPFFLLPADLAAICLEQTQAIPGGSGIRSAGKRLVMGRSAGEVGGLYIVEADYGHVPVRLRLVAYPFTSSTDGSLWYWLETDDPLPGFDDQLPISLTNLHAWL